MKITGKKSLSSIMHVLITLSLLVPIAVNLIDFFKGLLRGYNNVSRVADRPSTPVLLVGIFIIFLIYIIVFKLRALFREYKEDNIFDYKNSKLLKEIGIVVMILSVVQIVFTFLNPDMVTIKEYYIRDIYALIYGLTIYVGSRIYEEAIKQHEQIKFTV